MNQNLKFSVRSVVCKQEGVSKQCIVPTVKHGGGNVMVRGCSSAAAVGGLIKVTGRIKKEIILKHSESLVFRLIGAGFEIQQDRPKTYSKRHYSSAQKQSSSRNVHLDRLAFTKARFKPHLRIRIDI